MGGEWGWGVRVWVWQEEGTGSGGSGRHGGARWAALTPDSSLAGRLAGRQVPQCRHVMEAGSPGG